MRNAWKRGSRLGKVKKTVGKLSKMLNRIGRRNATRFVHPAVIAGATWGSSCLGVSSSQLAERRRLAHNLIATHTAGRSATIDLDLYAHKRWRLDPAYMLLSAPIKALAASMGRVGPEGLDPPQMER